MKKYILYTLVGISLILFFARPFLVDYIDFEDEFYYELENNSPIENYEKDF